MPCRPAQGSNRREPKNPPHDRLRDIGIIFSRTTRRNVDRWLGKVRDKVYGSAQM